MSTIKTDTLQNVAGSKSVPVSTVVDGSAKAWVNFNGTGTVAIRAAFNVTSITDNAVGDYTLNFTSAMPDTNYCITIGNSGTTATQTVGVAGIKAVSATGAVLKSTTQLNVVMGTGNNTGFADHAEMNVAIFR